MKKLGLWTWGAVLAGLTALTAPAYAQSSLLTNGGFEAGSFAGWTETGDTVFNGVQCSGPGSSSVYQGNCSAYFGPFASVGGVQQTVDLGSAGQRWDLSFALLSDGGSPSTFSVQFGGQTLLALSDLPAGNYTLYHFNGVATTRNPTLAFNFFSPAGYLSLDAVSVSAVPEPETFAMIGAGLVGMILARRRKLI